MRILFLANDFTTIYYQRKELVKKLLENNNEVILCYPNDNDNPYFLDLGCQYIEINMQKKGTNPFKDYKIIKQYKKIVKKINPDIILSYTIKPNIYGTMAANKYNVPIICNITGLGNPTKKKSMTQRIIFWLYKNSLKNANHIFVQNDGDLEFLINNKLVKKEITSLLPGSGVNLEEFNHQKYPEENIIKFAFISRILKEKGIDNYLEAAKYIKVKYPNTLFIVCGYCQKEYEEIIKKNVDNGIIKYLGVVDDIKEIYKNINCLVHPSYYPEGLSNVLLESSASGRPIITTNNNGCKEVLDDGVNGYLIKMNDTKDLIKKLEKFINLDAKEKEQMGINARNKVEQKFCRSIVINEYLKYINIYAIKNDE